MGFWSCLLLRKLTGAAFSLAENEGARSRLHRVDGRRAVTVQGDVDRDVANAQELPGLARAEFRIPGTVY